MMASISRLCPDDRLVRRADLVVRPIPEIRMCMVYRPRPARVVTLNLASWLLFEACTGDTVREIEAAVLRVQAGTLKLNGPDEVLAGLQQLVELSLVEPCRDRPPTTREGATT
jgi:hypothetical protein